MADIEDGKVLAVRGDPEEPVAARAEHLLDGPAAMRYRHSVIEPGSTKPAGYSFLAELADTKAEQISIEAAQPKLDLGVLRDLSSKKIMLGVLDLGNPEIETAEIVANRIRNGLKHVAADRLVLAPDCARL